MKKPDWLTPTLVVSVLFGSFAASVFTWWMSREVPLGLGYQINTTSTGGDATTSSLVPGLTLKIGEENIPAIYTHVLNINRTSGYADSVDLAIAFPRDIRVFGKSFDAPSPVHHMNCEVITRGVKCKIGPIDGQGEYRALIATDVDVAPRLTVAGKNVELESFEQIAKRKGGLRDPTFLSVVASLLVGFAILQYLTRESRRKGEEATRYAIQAIREKRQRDAEEAAKLQS